MSAEDREFLDQIYKFIDENLKDMDSDPQKTPVSEQIQALRPILQELAMKYKMPVEDAFIKYMDLASEAAVERDKLAKLKVSWNQHGLDLIIKAVEYLNNLNHLSMQKNLILKNTEIKILISSYMKRVFQIII